MVIGLDHLGLAIFTDIRSEANIKAHKLRVKIHAELSRFAQLLSVQY